MSKNKELFPKARALVDAGKTIREACAQVGLTESGYYFYQNKLAGKPARKQVRRVQHDIVRLPVPSNTQREGKICVVLGSVKQVSELLKSL